MSARKAVVALLVVCFVLASGWAWYAAAQVRTPAQQAQQATPPAPSLVTAPVEEGPLVDMLELEGVVSRSSLLTISGGEASEGVLKQVITEVPVKAGGRIRNGQVIAEVSGRPVIALSGAFPAYRDLSAGATGPDVRQLQKALRSRYGTPVTGKLDSRTQSDVRRLYRANGYELAEAAPPAAEPEPEPSASPTTTSPGFVLPAGELAFVPRLPATVGSVPAKVGGNGAGALLTVASGAWRLQVALTEETERKVEEAQDTADFALAGLDDVSVEFLRLTGKADGEGPRSAVFALDGDTGLRLGATMRLRMETKRSPEDAVVVPASALWTSADGTVSVSVAGENGARTDVAVTVRTTAEGRVAVTADDGALRVGDRVVVAERDAQTTGG
ncbi:hypothetical protein [Actinoplanes sp. GCM10030250]|uniref:hypothetical protein n=1 Tax=Actinoplanes sp. GCM10030250 TaxID=3273376 RepID=UPI003606E2F3